MKTPSRGFTLFEVLAAVAVLGLVYVTLASTAMQGLRAEGEAARRIEASLLADHAMSELELQLAAGTAPEVGVTETESEDGGYRVVVEVAPYSLDALAAAGAADSERGGRPEPRELPLLVASRAGADTALLSLSVAVRWQEGVYEREVRRASFAYDSAAAEPFLSAIAASGAGEADAEGELSAEDLELPEAGGRGQRAGGARQ